MKLKLGSHYTSTLVSCIAKILTAFMQIILSPILLSKIGVKDFALYSFLIGISSWFTLLDMSIGTIIQNKISYNYKNNIDSNDLINHAFCSIIYLSIFYVIIFFLLTPILLKFFLSKITLGVSTSLIITWISFIAFYTVNILLQMVIKIYYAKDKALKANIYSLIGTGTTFLLVIAVLKLIQSTYIISFIIGAITIANIIINLYLFLTIIKPMQWINLKKCLSFLKLMFKESRHLFLFTICGMLILQIDYFLIAHFLQAIAIIQYNFISRVFMAVFSFYSLVLVNFYPICSKLIYDKRWNDIIKQTLIHISIGLGMVIISAILFIVFRKTLSFIFLKNVTSLDITLILLFAVYYLIRVVSDTFAIILTILNKGYYLLKLVIFQLIISISLQVFLIKIYGLAGIMIGLIVSFIPTSLIFIPKKVYAISLES